MKKAFIVLLLSTVLQASVLVPPQCFVDIEITQANPGEVVATVVKVHTLFWCIMERIKPGQVHNINVDFNRVEKGKVYKAGVVRGSSMGSSGKAFPWVHWEIVSY